jgi:hypothetical protein
MLHDDPWPELPLRAWQDTCETLHMWSQIIGKVRMAQTPYVNHWWNVTLQVSASGLTTGVMPHGSRAFSIELDLVRHCVRIDSSAGERSELPLRAQPVAEFHATLMHALAALDLRVVIRPVPVEVPKRIPFPRDREHASYDRMYATRYQHALLQAQRVMSAFRGRFLGKASPVHFFWGGFDLAATRFSGRPAPVHGPVPFTPDQVVREAYSHEVSSCGFWPGAAGVSDAAFYAYAYPEPDGFSSYPITPSDAYYSKELGEFLLPYEAVRRAKDPDATLLDFLQSTYEAAAEAGEWNRVELEYVSAPEHGVSRSA